MQTITTTINHTPASFSAETLNGGERGVTISRTVESLATVALRRVGHTAVEWNRRSGGYLDSTRIAAARFDGRAFGRAADGNDRPDLALQVIVDNSGSMGAHETYGGYGLLTRRAYASAVAVGLASAARSISAPVTLGYHAGNTNGEICAHASTRGFLALEVGSQNYDAWSVLAWLRSVARPAKRTLVVLLTDGAPCGDRFAHATVARECARIVESSGGEMVAAFVGRIEADERQDANYGLRRCAADWGAIRTADCTRSAAALPDAIVRALLRMRGQRG